MLADMVTGVTSSVAPIFEADIPSLITAMLKQPSSTAQSDVHGQTPGQRLFDTVAN